MGKKVIELLYDDIDGEEVEAAETVKFAVDGAEYEIDLTEQHAKELRAAAAPYVESARRITKSPSRR